MFEALAFPVLGSRMVYLEDTESVTQRGAIRIRVESRPENHNLAHALFDSSR